MTTLNDILSLVRMEDQWIYVFDTEGNEFYEGFKYGNDTDTKDPNYGIVPTIEIEVKANERLLG